MGSSKSVTVGYRYYMGLHFGICHGPVDEVQQITVGEREAWTGAQTTSGSIGIAADELFGGDKREGGIYGILDVQMGEPAQAANSYLASLLGAGIPAFRGILSAVWRGGQVAANNPYVKPWAFRVKRIVQGWTGGTAWLAEKAPIIFAAGNSGDATVKLLTRFEGASSADVSKYAIGSGSINNPTGVLLADGYVRVGVTPDPYATGVTGLSWESPELTACASLNPEMTWEFIYSVSTDTGVTSSYKTIGIIDSDHVAPEVGRQFRINLSGGYPGDPPSARHRINITPGSDPPTWEASSSCLVEDGIATFHIAIQRRTNGDIQIFYMGDRVVDWTSGFGTGGTPGDGFVRICNYPYSDAWDIRCHATRVSARLVYSGATYDVPTPAQLTADFDVITSDITGMNPAHIVYQCLTDTAWGMGYPTGSVDGDSFTAAANALYEENFGLCMLWNRQETIEAFIQVVLDHVGAMLYVKPDTGAFALKLIRDDYDRDTLPQYGPTNLIRAENYQRQAWGETINEITAVYTDYATGKDVSVTVQDAANVMAQSGVVAQTRAYPGIPWPPLAQRVALRDLNAASTPLARIKLTATRAAWSVFPGDVFRLTWPDYGIADVVYRVLAVNRGTLQDGQIIIDAVEDVFALPENTYFLADQPGLWEDPSNEPAVAPYRAMIETPYWDLVRNLSAADLDYVDSLSGYLQTVAVRPSNDATNYTICTRVGAADYVARGNGDFCPSATIVETLTKTTTAITLENGIDLDIVEVGGYAVIDDEYVLVSAIDWLAGTATISRGVLDTVPADHAADSRIWFADGYQGFETTEYADAEVVDVKLLPVTGRGELAIADAASNSLTFDQRQYRPYPPAKVRFDTLEWPAIIEGSADVVLTWAHRDRLAQTAYIVEQDEASIGPEASVTYSVEVTDDALSVLHSATGITAATATVPASALTDGLLRFRLWSVRGGLASWQIHEHWAVWGDVRVTESGEARITEAGEYRVTD
jgi:hypothetical protein